MHLDIRSQRLVITDERDAAAFRRYLSDKERALSLPVRALWRDQSDVITTDTAQAALTLGHAPDEWTESWDRMTRVFVRDDVTSEWLSSIDLAGDVIAKKVNRLQRKQFDFNSTMTAVKAWLDDEGGKLIVNLTAAQMKSVQALLQSQIALGVTSPYVLAQRVKHFVGLTAREATAVSRVMTTLTEEGLSAELITKRIEKYANYLHRKRAARIAQTEIANSYNFGQMESIRQAVNAGELATLPDKNWMAAGPNPCDICLANEAQGDIGFDETFQSGHTRPTAHPSCACSLSYTVRR